MSLPSDSELVEQVRLILVKAYETVSVGQHTKRKIREILTDHFGVDLNCIKKKLYRIIEEQNEIVSAEFDVRDDYVPHTHSDVKADVFSKPKSSLRTEDDRDRSANVGSKRNQPSSDVEQDNTKHDAEPDKVIAAIAAAAAAAAAASGTARPESGYMSQEFSELEDDAPQLRKKARRTTSKSAASTKRNATASSSKAGSGEAEQRLARLKKLVTECGVRKQWKKLYLDAGVSESDLRGQCNIVQGVLKDLGMTGKGSLEQAKKIRAQREFADELAALQENQVLHSARRQSSTRRGPTHTLTNANNAQNSSSQSTNLQHHSSFKKISRKIPLSDSDDSQDHPPAQTKAFKSSLASFAADLNSD
ncbi:uncharacterized protein UMAG_01475 [Mycosarcoma maydis]|uniref:Uncharacterized protein n=1 Tax=Mycosarcoma maydis TaxID=5270 RepID=A0A0D1CAC9_MYCMD|nr:uncharacterized protein UMAG_01475 [Ustilago maydis 521]KIS70302.1 hypothetical protein UMAG_01475 [Ustilago maydis 521]|eukprot:XP_011387533.1 hypothetical protein UMAG_01475 [Ustilago maydis 521]